MSERIKPQDITPTTQSPFMTVHAARCTQPLGEALESPELFLSVRSNLRAGDQVTLCRFESGDPMKARVLEYVRVMITQSTPLAVEFETMEPVHIVGAAKPELEPETPEDEPLELEVVPDPQGGFNVRQVATGHVEKHFKTKAPAERYVRDYGKQEAA